MLQTNEITAASIIPTNAQPAKSETTTAIANTARDATKDAGRVHIGGGMMRF
jgi:hypothetical protein